MYKTQKNTIFFLFQCLTILPPLHEINPCLHFSKIFFFSSDQFVYSKPLKCFTFHDIRFNSLYRAYSLYRDYHPSEFLHHAFINPFQVFSRFNSYIRFNFYSFFPSILLQTNRLPTIRRVSFLDEITPTFSFFFQLLPPNHLT